MKAFIDKHGNLIKSTVKGFVHAVCPFSRQPCHSECPHLDDSEPGCIRLSCGGIDVVFENSNYKKKDQQDEKTY